jgi:hypothetical protein
VFPGGMVKLIALAALVVVGFVVLGAVAKVLLWAALIAALVVIGFATYRLLSSSSETTSERTPH